MLPSTGTGDFCSKTVAWIFIVAESYFALWFSANFCMEQSPGSFEMAGTSIISTVPCSDSTIDFYRYSESPREAMLPFWLKQVSRTLRCSWGFADFDIWVFSTEVETAHLGDSSTKTRSGMNLSGMTWSGCGPNFDIPPSFLIPGKDSSNGSTSWGIIQASGSVWFAERETMTVDRKPISTLWRGSMVTSLRPCTSMRSWLALPHVFRFLLQSRCTLAWCVRNASVAKEVVEPIFFGSMVALILSGTCLPRHNVELAWRTTTPLPNLRCTSYMRPHAVRSFKQGVWDGVLCRVLALRSMRP